MVGLANISGPYANRPPKALRCIFVTLIFLMSFASYLQGIGSVGVVQLSEPKVLFYVFVVVTGDFMKKGSLGDGLVQNPTFVSNASNLYLLPLLILVYSVGVISRFVSLYG